MWVVFAILARVFWAMTNAVDQVLARAHPAQGPYAALILEFLGRLPCAVIIYLLCGPFRMPASGAIYAAGAVLGITLGLLPYFITLRREHAHDVTPYLELTPVFLIILAYVFKGEILTPTQLAGAAIVVVSGFLFSWDFTHGHFKTAIFAVLALASLFFAFQQYYLSQAEVFAGIWAAAAYYYFGCGLVGLTVFLAWKDLRKTVISTLVRSRGKTALLTLATNILSMLGIVTLLQAFRLAPTLGHVAALSGTQPIFSFALAWPLAKYLPGHFSEITFDRARLVKLISVGAIAVGICLLAWP